MLSSLDAAVRDALSFAVPALPLTAIHERRRARSLRGRNRRNALAAVALLLSFAGIAVIADRHPSTASAHAPAPIASLRPLPTIT
jgi:hypothetical protein